jgi:hypothetical protein
MKAKTTSGLIRQHPFHTPGEWKDCSTYLGSQTFCQCDVYLVSGESHCAFLIQFADGDKGFIALPVSVLISQILMEMKRRCDDLPGVITAVGAAMAAHLDSGHLSDTDRADVHGILRAFLGSLGGSSANN